MLLGGREDVEDAAAHRELAAALDEVGAGVGGGREVLDDPLERRLVTGVERDRAQVAQPRDDRLEDGAHRRDDDGERAVGVVAVVGVREPAQHRQALADGVAARAQPFVRERLPRGEQPDDARAEARLEGRLEVLGLATGGGDGQDGGARGGRGQDRDDGGTGARRGGRDDLRGGDREGLPEARGAGESGDTGAQVGQRGHPSQPSRADRRPPHRGPAPAAQTPGVPDEVSSGAAAEGATCFLRDFLR